MLGIKGQSKGASDTHFTPPSALSAMVPLEIEVNYPTSTASPPATRPRPYSFTRQTIGHVGFIPTAKGSIAQRMRRSSSSEDPDSSRRRTE